MTWEWSHSVEAYEAARENVKAKDREWLEVVWAEWEASTPESDEMDIGKYDEKLAKRLPEDILTDAIWEKMQEQALCTNGRWEAWCCPFGCGCHMVSFSYEDEDEEDDDWDDD
jgi:hypothetical protein